MTETLTAYRTCPLCEATCGLELTLEDDAMTAIRGDAEDVFSHGFICPKGFALKALHEDPDRIRMPLVRTASGFEEVSWDEAFAEIDRRLAPLLDEHGRDAVARLPRQPQRPQPRRAALRARVREGARARATSSPRPRSTRCPSTSRPGLMFGTALSIPVPDVDRTDHLLMLGANPLASNGSLLTAPDMRGRLRGIRDRGAARSS